MSKKKGLTIFKSSPMGKPERLKHRLDFLLRAAISVSWKSVSCTVKLPLLTQEVAVPAMVYFS